MIKKSFKVMLVLLMILGIAFSVSNFFLKTTNAVMTEEQLHFYWITGGYCYWCTPNGGGCYTVEAPAQ